jgi:hypothetical protein
LCFAGMPQMDKGPGLKAARFCGLFRGLKAPAPSEKSYLQLEYRFVVSHPFRAERGMGGAQMVARDRACFINGAAGKRKCHMG